MQRRSPCPARTPAFGRSFGPADGGGAGTGRHPYPQAGREPRHPTPATPARAERNRLVMKEGGRPQDRPAPQGGKDGPGRPVHPAAPVRPQREPPHDQHQDGRRTGPTRCSTWGQPIRAICHPNRREREREPPRPRPGSKKADQEARQERDYSSATPAQVSNSADKPLF
jgi:hypothetical protein